MTILFWLNPSRGTIYCRITVRGERAEISTGIKINPSRWDSARQLITGDSRVEIILTEMRLFFRRQELVLNFFSASTMKELWENRLKQIGKPSPKLIEVCPQGAGKGYDAMRHHLIGYGSRIRLDRINQAWADGFATYLSNNVQRSSALLYLAKLKTVIRRAIKIYPKGDIYPEMIEKIPFEGPEIRPQQTTQGVRPKYLTLSQYDTLKSLKLPPKENFYRNCFLWQCATGQGLSDMKLFTPYLILQDVKGNKYIKYRRTKTNVEALIPITPEVLTAMHDIGDWSNVRTLLEQTYNKHLRGMGLQIGYDKMTSHIGRHTFGVLRLIDGYSIESVSKMLGHGSITITEKVYAKVTIEKIFKEKNQISN